MGVNRSMARYLLYASLKYQGLDIYNIFTTQGSTHVLGFLNRVWHGTTTGQLLRTSLEYAKVELGIRGSYFNKYYEVYGHLGEDT